MSRPDPIQAFVKQLLERIPREDDAESRARLDREERAFRQEALRTSGLQLADRGWRSIVSGRLKETEALKAVRRWVDVTEGRSKSKVIRADTVVLVLCGGTGCGKSVAAGWAVTEARLSIGGRNVGVNDGRVGGLAAKSSALPGMRSGGWEGRAAYEALKGCPFLVVDDVGAQHAKGEQSAVHDVIDDRQRVRRTLITTNMTEEDFLKWLDPRTRSRLEEVGHVQSCGGKDLRSER